MCPFIVGPSSLTLVCADIGDVGDVDDGSVYGKETKQSSIVSFIFLEKVFKASFLSWEMRLGRMGRGKEREGKGRLTC